MTIQNTTSVCIIGSGPAKLLLSQLLANVGIINIVIDRKNRACIESRVRDLCPNA
jgi:p-hydroxybenzoate 3-monooxygenase